MRTVDGIEKELAARREKLERLREVQKSSEAASERTEKKRSAFLVDALTGNAQARKSLEAATVEFDAACRAQQDVTDAITQIEEEIAALEGALSAAVNESLRADARKLIEKRIADKRELRIQKMAEELEAEIDSLEESNEEIRRAFAQFDPEAAPGVREWTARLSTTLRVDRGRFGPAMTTEYLSYVPQLLANLLKMAGSQISSGETDAEESTSSESRSSVTFA